MNVLKNDKMIPAVVVALLVIVVAYLILTTPDRRDAGQKIGDAISELDKGPEKALRQLESRTPGDKLQDAIEDQTEDVKKSINQP